MELMNMVHDNPGLVKYESAYNDPVFLKERGYDGKTFDLYNCAQYGLTWDGLTNKYGRNEIFPKGSKAREWVLKRKEELLSLYQQAVEAGLKVSFMMDIIVLPAALLKQYPEILNSEGKIDILKPLMKEILEELFDEMFREFPHIHGIYIRYGETYTGEKYGYPYHIGNNPIVGNSDIYHVRLIQYLIEIVCKKYQREIYYRSWGFGAFQRDKETYLKISDQIKPNKYFYFCIKHTSGDFHRCNIFNQTLNCGKHQQIVEVQAAREYEGKGAYPNYIADGVIHGFEEYKWQMRSEENQCLKDIINAKDSLIKGIWTWSRGGGWDGPYINGRNGKHGEIVVQDGTELWCDLNAYVISKWAKNPEKSERYYAMKYASNILQMSEVDCEIFYEICILSAKAVLRGRGCNIEKIPWNVWWTRDQNIRKEAFFENVANAVLLGAEEILFEKQRSVELWKEIVELSKRLSTGNQTDYIVTTCEYGYYLYAIYEVMYRANICALLGGREDEVRRALVDYEALWKQWRNLKERNPHCPTLYVKEDTNLQMIGYEGNRGFDSVMNHLKDLGRGA